MLHTIYKIWNGIFTGQFLLFLLFNSIFVVCTIQSLRYFCNDNLQESKGKSVLQDERL